MDCSNHAVANCLLDAPVTAQPLFDVPTVLKERPNVILIVDVTARLRRLHAVEEATRPVELGPLVDSDTRSDLAHDYCSSADLRIDCAGGAIGPTGIAATGFT